MSIEQSPDISVPSVIGGLRPLSELGLGDEVISGLVESAPDGIVMTDHAGQILLVNGQTEGLFGYERGELLGRHVEVLLPEQHHQVHRAHRTRYQAAPTIRAMGAGLGLLGRRKDGSEFPVEISLSPLQTSSGVFVVATVRDVTQRVAREAQHQRVLELLDATQDAIFIFDPETLTFTYVNQGAVDQVGYSREELLGMTMLHLTPEFTEAQVRERLDPLARGEVSSTMFTTVHRRRDGTDLPVEILLQVASGAGRPVAFVKLVRDITERVEAEQRRYQTEHELRLLEDRERIARDLHDTVIQRLFAAGMALQATSAVIASHEEGTRRISSVIDELDETIREVRTTIYGLHAHTTPAGLRSEILRVLDDERPALGFEPHVRFGGVLDAVPDSLARHLLATLREALSNIARHAHATTADVTIDAGAHVLLRVTDDGQGIPKNRTLGNGLQNMAHRANQLGGTFHTEPGNQGGTVLEWRVPNQDVEITPPS